MFLDDFLAYQYNFIKLCVSNDDDIGKEIIEETTAIQEEIHEAVSNVVSNVANTALKDVVNIGKWFVKMATKP